MRSWEDEQGFEAAWWGSCANTFGEELKHPTYARLMGLEMTNYGGQVGLRMGGKSILDIGGGPASMTLKTFGAGRRTVVEPCPYPDWTADRYTAAGVELVKMPAEDFEPDQIYDEAWCYNVLQHVKDPRAIVDMMLKHARVVRLCEWVDLPPHEGHPNELHSAELADWLGIAINGGYWDEYSVGWDLWVGGTYLPYLAFGGYVRTGA